MRAGQDQAAGFQGRERVRDVVAEAAQWLRPEHAAHDGRRPQQPLLGHRQGVHPRGQQRMQSVGQRAGPTVGHVRDQLVEEVRIPFGPHEDLLATLGVEGRRPRQAVEQIPAGPLRQRP
jgi:hypothetical protein